MWSTLLLALCLAQQPPEDGTLPEESPPETPDLPPPPVGPGSEAPAEGNPAPPLDGPVETLDEGISKEQYAFLEPKRHLLEQNPYAQVDFTAYSLEWGEVMLGVTGIHMGVIPRIQLGTQPLFDLLGIYNGSFKANLLRVGPVDLGLLGQGTYVPLGDFKGTFYSGGAMASVIVVPKWSIHVGGLYGRVNAKGIPNQPPALFKAWIPQDQIDQISADIEAAGIDPDFKANAIVWRFATDYRFNRRDSLVLQAQGLAYGSVKADLGDDLDPVVEEIIEFVIPFASDASVNEQQTFNPAQAYVVTLSWQFAWQQIGLRLGGGASADGLSWILQGNDLNYRFWGKTRLEDHRRKKGWQKSKKDVVK